MKNIYNFILDYKKNKVLQEFYNISKNDTKFRDLYKNDYILFNLDNIKQDIEKCDTFSELNMYKTKLDSIKILLAIF